jgi:hypothetical protein
MTTDRDTHVEDMTIRLLGGADLEAVRRLAERDSSVPPSMPLLGAATDGVLIAAITLDGSLETIADPFRPTADALVLLESRARQLQEAGSGRVGRRRRARRILPRGGSSLGGSPPGSGGRLLKL